MYGSIDERYRHPRALVNAYEEPCQAGEGRRREGRKLPSQCCVVYGRTDDREKERAEQAADNGEQGNEAGRAQIHAGDFVVRVTLPNVVLRVPLAPRVDTGQMIDRHEKERRGLCQNGHTAFRNDEAHDFLGCEGRGRTALAEEDGQLRDLAGLFLRRPALLGDNHAVIHWHNSGVGCRIQKPLKADIYLSLYLLPQRFVLIFLPRRGEQLLLNKTKTQSPHQCALVGSWLSI